jgi:protein ImuA
MTRDKENLAVLRAFLEKPVLARAAHEIFAPLGHGPADTLLHGGLRRGALHEVFAARAGAEAAASGFAAALAQRVLGKNKWLLWVRQDFSALEAGEIDAGGLLELGIDPSRAVLVRAANAADVLRAGAAALECKGLGAVIIEPWGEAKVFDLVASRRITMAAQTHGVTAIVLRVGAKPQPSTAETRWLVNAHPSSAGDEAWGKPLFDAALVRNRHGRTGHWVMEWDCNDGIFREPAAHSCALAAAPFHRQAEAPVESIRQAG